MNDCYLFETRFSREIFVLPKPWTSSFLAVCILGLYALGLGRGGQVQRVRMFA